MLNKIRFLCYIVVVILFPHVESVTNVVSVFELKKRETFSVLPVVKRNNKKRKTPIKGCNEINK